MFKYVKLGDLAEFRNGLNFSKSSTGSNVKIIGVTDFKSYLTPDYSELEEITIDGELKEEDYVQNGDIIFVRSNGNKDLVGRSLYIDRDSRTSFSGFCIRLRFTSSEVLPKYFAFYTKSGHFKKSISKGSLGTNINNLNQGILSDVLVPLPSVKRQKTVIKILESITYKISLNNKINAELEAMAKLIYDYWFVQFDFPISAATAASMGQPELEGKPYKASGGPMVYNKQLKREIPEGWEDGVLGDLLTNISINIEPQDFPDLPYLPIDKLPTEKLYYQEYEDRNQAQSSLIKFNEDDILLGAMRVYFHRVCNAIEDGISRSTMISLRAKESHLKNYALFTLNRKEAILYATKHSTGTSIPYAKWSNSLEKYRICIPKDELVINRFNNLIDPILDKFKVLAKENQKLSELRDWLLPMLMNGQVSIKEAEEYPDSYRESMAAEPREGYGD